MNILTHKEIDKELCGNVLIVKEGFSRVELKTTQRMTVDDTGLVHGGFIFGLADYSAMVAVNYPNVVLGAADVQFLKPAKAGDVLIAEAKVDSNNGRRKAVSVSIFKGSIEVFKGVFICFVLDHHVLKKIYFNLYGFNSPKLASFIVF